MLNLSPDEIKKKIQEQTQLSREDIDKRVQEKLTQLSGLISEEGALHIIANELEVQFVPSKEERRIKDLLPGMRDVEQPMRVIQSYDLREFESKYDGGVGKVKSFLAGDESGVIRVTCWGVRAEEAEKLKEQDIVVVKSAYVKENQGRAELHLNNNSELTINPEGVEVATTSPSRSEDGEYVRKSINELSKGDYRVELLGTIVQAYDPRFFERKDGTPGFVTNIMIDDGKGNVRVGCFDEVAAQVLGMKKEEVLSNKEGSFEEEKTAVLGEIVKIKGRAKLNTVYNSIDVTADEIDMSPDAKAELERLQKENPSESTQENLSEEKSAQQDVSEEETVEKKPEEVAEEKQTEETKQETPSEEKAEPEGTKKKPEEEAISLDELDDLDFSDLEDV